MELDLLAVLADKENFNRFYRFVKQSAVSKESWIILKDMEEWFKTNEELNWSSFSTWFKVIRHSTYKESLIASYQAIFSALEEHETPPVLENTLIRALIERDYSSRIATVADKTSEGMAGHTLDDVIDLIDSYHIEIDKASDLDKYIVTDDFTTLQEAVSLEHGYHWRLDALNQSLGPIRKGDFLIIAARPDTGKTTMLTSEASFIAEQFTNGEKVYWFNNEEGGEKVKWRFVQAALGWSTADMNADINATQEAFLDMYGGEVPLVLVDNKRLHIKDVEEYLKRGDPGLVIFDQLWKVNGFERESNGEVDRQTKLFSWGREIASLYAPTITVHQADGTAEGQKWIEMNQLYGSKTGIQGEADAIITLGMSTGDGPTNERGLYVPKNKLSGGTSPELRKGRFEVLIDPEHARYKMPE